jgi:hypothetical protein
MTSFGGFAQASTFVANDDEQVIEASTPWMAASEGNLALLQASLTKLNLPFKAADENGYTLLHAAAAYNQIAAMGWLLQQDNVDVNAKDSDGDTPLHHVDKKEAAEYLIEVAKANPNEVNEEGKTALVSKEEDLIEMMEEEDEDDDVTALRELVAYLKTKTAS